jgi:uncharacterized protein (TIGR02246 family)
MHADEQAIRDLVQTWLNASTDDDLDRILTLMSDDVVFLTPGQKPFGKDTFAAASRASRGKVRVEAAGDVQEVRVEGGLGFCWTRLNVKVSPAQGGEAKQFSGYSLSILRKEPDGRWVFFRDANLVLPEQKPKAVRGAVPVFHVSSVAKSIAWYRDVLGFSADPFGPPDEPVFAILCRDGVELMLQSNFGETGKTRPATPEQGWSAYLRVADVHGVREAVLAKLPDAKPIVTREYGCLEFNLTDPDGHVLVIGQCG